MNKLTPLPSVAYAVDHIFGGTIPFSRELGVAKQTVSTWKRVGNFPPEYTSMLVPRIIAAGYEPQPKHFNQKVAV